MAAISLPLFLMKSHKSIQNDCFSHFGEVERVVLTIFDGVNMRLREMLAGVVGRVDRRLSIFRRSIGWGLGLITC